MLQLDDAQKLFEWENRGSYFRLVYNGHKPADDIEAATISVAKWGKTLSFKFDHPNEVVDPGSNSTCGFCMLYNYPSLPMRFMCMGCPISKKTGQILCHGTPHDQFVEAKDAAPVEIVGAMFDEWHWLSELRQELIRDAEKVEQVKKEVDEIETQETVTAQDVKPRHFYFVVDLISKIDGRLIGKTALTLHVTGPICMDLMNTARETAKKQQEKDGHYYPVDCYWVSFMAELEQ